MTQVTLKTIYDAIQDFRDEVRNTYVTKDEFSPVRSIVYGMVEFSPVRSIVYGMVGLILTSVMVAIVTGIVNAK